MERNQAEKFTQQTQEVAQWMKMHWENKVFRCFGESISPCEKFLTAPSMLSHFLKYHINPNALNQIECCEIFKGEKQKLAFDPNKIEYGQTQVLGLLAYGGVRGDRNTLPGWRGICEPNIELPTEFKNLMLHLPVLIMGGRTSSLEAFNDKQYVRNPNNPKKDEYLFWLTAPEVAEHVKISLTLLSAHGYINKVNHNCPIRNLKKSQNPTDVLRDNEVCLNIPQGGMSAMSYKFKKNVCMEFVLTETM